MTVPFERVKWLVAELAGLTPEEREARIENECGDDLALLAEVESLLQHVDIPMSFLDRPLPRGDSGVMPDKLLEAAGAVAGMPERIHQYRILRRIASGGMGTVYEAEQVHPRRIVALKMIRREFVSERLCKRLGQESELLGRLQHRGIGQIFEAGTFDRGEGPEPFLAMEFVKGLPLTEHARRSGLDTKARVALFIRTCDAVEYAHCEGIVHRDLKPDNILVDRTGQPKILDFGVACSLDSAMEPMTRHTDHGEVIGTLAYMSPEQISGDRDHVDQRSDVYALGVLLFELLADRLPLSTEGRALPDAARLITEIPPTRLGVVHKGLRGDLETIAGKALEKDPLRRYATAGQLAEDLRRYLADVPIVARPPSSLYRLRKFARRHTALLCSTAATVLVSVAGVVVAGVLAMRSADDEARALQAESQALRALAMAKVTIADRIIEDGPRGARRALDEVPANLRNWEWRHLSSGLEPSRQFLLPDRAVGDGAGSVAIGRDGSIRYVHTLDRTITVQDLETGVTVSSFTAPVNVQGVRLSRDAARLAVISADASRLFVFDLEGGEPLLDSSGHEGLANPSLCADGSRVAVEVRSRRSVLVLDVATGAVLFDPEPKDQGKLDALTSPLLSPSGERVALLGSHAVTVFDCRRGAIGRRMKGFKRRGYGFDVRGERIAGGTLGQAIIVSEVGTGAIQTRWKCTERIQATAFAGDVERMATASLREIRVWDLKTHRSVASFHFGAHELCLSSDGTVLAAAAAEGGLLWYLNASRCRTLTSSGERMLSIAFHPDGSMVASLSQDGRVEIWDTRTGESLATSPATLVPGADDRGSGRELQFTADGLQLFTTGHCYQAWNLMSDDGFGPSSEDRDRGRAWVEYWGRGSYVGGHGAAVSHGSMVLLPQGDAVAILDAKTGKPVAPRIRCPGGLRASAIAMSPDGRYVATGHEGGTIRLWNRSDGSQVQATEAHDDHVYSIAFSPDGTRLVSGGLDFSVRVWDVASLNQVLELRGHEDSLRSVAFSPDGTQIASCGSDGTLRLWDSVPAHRRAAQARTALELRESIRPEIAKLSRELGERARVAARVLADPSLGSTRREAALRLLMTLE